MYTRCNMISPWIFCLTKFLFLQLGMMNLTWFPTFDEFRWISILDWSDEKIYLKLWLINGVPLRIERVCICLLIEKLIVLFAKSSNYPIYFSVLSISFYYIHRFQVFYFIITSLIILKCKSKTHALVNNLRLLLLSFRWIIRKSSRIIDYSNVSREKRIFVLKKETSFLLLKNRTLRNDLFHETYFLYHKIAQKRQN